MEVLSLVVASGSGGSGDGTLLVGVHAGVHPVGVVRVVVAVVDGELEGAPRAAELLEISYPSLLAKIREYGVDASPEGKGC